MAKQLYRKLKEEVEERPPELTSGSTFKHVLRLGLPSMFAMGLQASYDTVDLIWIGHTDAGANAMAAITIFGFLFALIIVLNLMIDVATTTLVSRYYGAKRYNAARLVTGQAWSSKFILSIPVAIALNMIAGSILTSFGVVETAPVLQQVPEQHEYQTR